MQEPISEEQLIDRIMAPCQDASSLERLRVRFSSEQVLIGGLEPRPTICLYLLDKIYEPRIEAGAGQSRSE